MKSFILKQWTYPIMNFYWNQSLFPKEIKALILKKYTFIMQSCLSNTAIYYQEIHLYYQGLIIIFLFKSLDHKELHIYYANFFFKFIYLLSINTFLLLRLFIGIKVFSVSYLKEIIYFKAVDISYKDFLLQSKPLS